MTLPVTFDDTVAWRRATTYPDASNTLFAAATLGGLRATSVSTRTVADPGPKKAHRSTATPTTPSTMAGNSQLRFAEAGALRSILSWLILSAGSAIPFPCAL
jgi:hypothetical protein